MGDRRVPAQLGCLSCPCYAAFSLRETSPLLIVENQTALCSGTGPLPRDWPSTNESPLLHMSLPVCPHLLLGIKGHTLDLLLHWALDFHWLEPPGGWQPLVLAQDEREVVTGRLAPRTAACSYASFCTSVPTLSTFPRERRAHGFLRLPMFGLQQFTVF